MSESVDALVAAFCDERQISQRRESLVKRAEEEGYPQVAKAMRAIIVSEGVRTKLYRGGIASHAGDSFDFYVCPHCGLIFARETPEKCPVDDTAGDQFERIG